MNCNVLNLIKENPKDVKLLINLADDVRTVSAIAVNKRGKVRFKPLTECCVIYNGKFERGLISLKDLLDNKTLALIVEGACVFKYVLLHDFEFNECNPVNKPCNSVTMLYPHVTTYDEYKFLEKDELRTAVEKLVDNRIVIEDEWLIAPEECIIDMEPGLFQVTDEFREEAAKILNK